MKLTRASSYALIAVVHMAQNSDGKAMASHEVAKIRGIPERFLLKVLKPLVTKGILQSIKGPHGGYKLARPAGDITLLEIIEAIDGDVQGSVPPAYTPGKEEKKPNPAEQAAIDKLNAPLNHKLLGVCRQTADVVKDHLKKVRLTDLIGGKTPKAKMAKAED